MFVEEEIAAFRAIYREMKSVSLSDFLSSDEIEAISLTARNRLIFFMSVLI